jgi:hypothetical protein
VAAKAKKSGGRSELEHAASPIPSQGGPSGHAWAGDESLFSQWLKNHDDDSSFSPTSLDVA